MSVTVSDAFLIPLDTASSKLLEEPAIASITSGEQSVRVVCCKRKVSHRPSHYKIESHYLNISILIEHFDETLISTMHLWLIGLIELPWRYPASNVTFAGNPIDHQTGSFPDWTGQINLLHTKIKLTSFSF
jgi:hypothetical protein